VQISASRHCSYFASFYNVMDFSIAALYPGIIAVHVANYILEQDITWYDPDAYTKINTQVALAMSENIMFSLMVFAAWIKLFDYLGVFPMMYKFIVMIELMVEKLLSFLAVFLLIIAAFASGEFIAYGYKDPASYTWLYAFLARLIGVISTNPLVQSHNQSSRLLGHTYLILFLMFVQCLLLSLIIAMMTSGYEEAQNQSSDVLAQRQYAKLIEHGFTKPPPKKKKANKKSQPDAIYEHFRDGLKLITGNTNPAERFDASVYQHVYDAMERFSDWYDRFINSRLGPDPTLQQPKRATIVLAAPELSPRVSGSTGGSTGDIMMKELKSPAAP